MSQKLHRQHNKKLGRCVEYLEGGERCLVYTFERDRPDEMVLKGEVTRDEAHRWIHGTESPGDAPEIAPTADEMIDAVADALKKEMSDYMDWGISSEEALTAMWNAVRRGKKLTRGWW